jgi:hypothetical protein
MGMTVVDVVTLGQGSGATKAGKQYKIVGKIKPQKKFSQGVSKGKVTGFAKKKPKPGPAKKKPVPGPAKKKPKPGAKGKAGATDKPSWVKEQPNAGESGKDFATRLLDEKNGPGNYDTGPGSEFNQIKKWVDRHFIDP